MGRVSVAAAPRSHQQQARPHRSAMAAGAGGGGGDLVAVLRSYVERMLREARGMKVLLLDGDTTRTVSTVASQSDILEQEVYLVQTLDAPRGGGDQLFHLKVRGCRGRGVGRVGGWVGRSAAAARADTDKRRRHACLHRRSASCAPRARTLRGCGASSATRALASTTCVSGGVATPKSKHVCGCRRTQRHARALRGTAHAPPGARGVPRSPPPPPLLQSLPTG